MPTRARKGPSSLSMAERSAPETLKEASRRTLSTRKKLWSLRAAAGSTPSSDRASDVMSHATRGLNSGKTASYDFCSTARQLPRRRAARR